MPTAGPRQLPYGVLVLLLGGLTALGPLSIDMYLPALPAMQGALQASGGAIQWTLTTFFIGLALSQLVGGTLADRIGRRPVLLTGLALYTAASLGCALANDIESLLFWRFVQALGGGAALVIPRTVVRDLFDVREGARALSLLLLVMGVAPIIAPLIGGWMLVAFDWHAIFFSLAAFSALCWIVAGVLLPETVPTGIVKPSLFAPREWLEILRHGAFLRYTLASTAAFAGMFAYIASSPFVFIEYLALTPTQYALVFGSNAAGLIAGSQLNARWVRRLGPERLLARGHQAAAIAALLLLGAAFAPGLGLWALLLPMWVYVASLGFISPNATALMMAPFGDRAGVAAALSGTIAFVIAGVTTSVIGLLHADGPVPMAAAIALLGVGGWLIYRWPPAPGQRVDA